MLQLYGVVLVQHHSATHYNYCGKLTRPLDALMHQQERAKQLTITEKAAIRLFGLLLIAPHSIFSGYVTWFA